MRDTLRQKIRRLMHEMQTMAALFDNNARSEVGRITDLDEAMLLELVEAAGELAVHAQSLADSGGAAG